MPQDRVRRCGVEVEIGQHELPQVRQAFHVQRLAQRHRDVARIRILQLFLADAVQKIDGLLHARLELVDGGFGVFVLRHRNTR